MAKPSANLRLFAAIYPPLDVATELSNSLATLSLPPHRTTPCEQIHLTMQFIGDTPVSGMEKTLESVERSVAGLPTFGLTPSKLITLPERGPARLIAAETDSPGTLLEIQKRLATRLARNVRDKAGDRFRPHLTLCRFRIPTRGISIDHALCMSAFQVERIVLMKSVLHSSGAQHKEVASFDLSNS